MEPSSPKKESEKNMRLTELEIQGYNNHFFDWVKLPEKERKITEIFKKHKSKFSEENKALFLHPNGHVYEQEDFRLFFNYEKNIPIPMNKEYNFIYDCLNFVCYEQDYKPALDEEKFKEKILYDFSLLNEKGTLMLLLDVYFVKNFFDMLIKALGSEYNTKLFINFYFMEKYDFLFIITIQKMSKVETPINLLETKVLITDFFSNLHSHLICSKTIKEIDNYLDECLKKMQNYYIQCKLNYSNLKTLKPGKFLEMRMKISPLNPAVDFIVTITDNSKNIDSKNVKTIAVVILYHMTQELMYQSTNSFDVMTQMLNVGRLITLECALLNPMNMNEIGYELQDDIEMMKPNDFKEKIKIQGWEDNNPKYLVYQGNNYLIRDCEEKPNLFFRELFYTTNNDLLNAIMAKIKIKFMSKSNIKNSENNFPMETQDKFKNKGVIKCIDENHIEGFYERCIICMTFYLNLNQLPKNTIKIMDIGAGLGIMSFYFYRVFKGNCEIDNIEKKNWMHDIGIKYFGIKNYDKHGNRIHWFIDDVEKCIKKMTNQDKVENKYENKIEYYDLIFNEINDIIPKQYSCPPESQFTDDFLKNIKSLLKNSGIYIVNVQTRSFKVLYNTYLQIVKYFTSLYTISSENGLSSIYICFKDKVNQDKIGEIFERNKNIILQENVIESSLVKSFYIEVISKIKDVQEDIKKLEENSKKI